jgi:hypothetical protein
MFSSHTRRTTFAPVFAISGSALPSGICEGSSLMPRSMRGSPQRSKICPFTTWMVAAAPPAAGGVVVGEVVGVVVGAGVVDVGVEVPELLVLVPPPTVPPVVVVLPQWWRQRWSASASVPEFSSVASLALHAPRRRA